MPSNPLVKNLQSLYQTSQEEVQTLAGQAGVNVPTTPLGAEMLGATPDQAKMMGVKPSKERTLRVAAEGGADLATAERRREEIKQQVTPEEAEKQKRAEQFKGLDAVADRFAILAKKQLSESLQAPQSQLVIDESKIPSNLSDADRARFTEALERVKSGTSTRTDLATLQELTGATQPPDVNSFFKSKAEAISGTAAQVTPETVKLSSFKPEDLQELGFQSIDQLGELLGLSPEQAQNLTVGDLQKQVIDIRTKEYEQVADLIERMNSPATGEAEREQLRQQLRAMGAIGTGRAEQTVKTLEQSLADADQVTVAGNSYSINELLSDDNVSKLVKQYVEGDQTARDAFKKAEPELAGYIEAHEAEFAAASKGIEAAEQDYLKIFEANAKKNDFGVPEKVNDAVMKQLIPGWGKPSGTELSRSHVPLFKTLESPLLNNDQKQNIILGLNRVSALPDGAKLVGEISNLSQQELAKLGAMNPGAFDNYISFTTQYKQLEEAKDNSEILANLFGADANLDEINQLIASSKAAIQSGLDSPVISPELMQFLDFDKDGKLDSNLSGVKDYVLKALGKGGITSVKDALDKGVRLDTLPQLSLIDTIKTAGIQQSQKDPNSLASRVSSYYTDGNISQAEAGEIISKFNTDEISSLLSNAKGITPEAKTVLNRALDADANARVKQDLKDLGFDYYTPQRGINSTARMSDSEFQQLEKMWTWVQGASTSDPRKAKYLKEVKADIAQALANQDYIRNNADATRMAGVAPGTVYLPLSIKPSRPGLPVPKFKNTVTSKPNAATPAQQKEADDSARALGFQV